MFPRIVIGPKIFIKYSHFHNIYKSSDLAYPCQNTTTLFNLNIYVSFGTDKFSEGKW